jgi:hypothetical protein
MRYGFDYRAKVGCRSSPANAVAYLEKSGLVAGHWRLFFVFPACRENVRKFLFFYDGVRYE